MMSFAQEQGVTPERISFIDALRWLLASCVMRTWQRPHVVPLRPDRWEPRAKKRRPKEYDLLTKPRQDYKTNAAYA